MKRVDVFHLLPVPVCRSDRRSVCINVQPLVDTRLALVVLEVCEIDEADWSVHCYTTN